MRSEPPAPDGIANGGNIGLGRFARALRELKYLEAHLPQGHSTYDVWMHDGRIDKIRVLLPGPPKSCFANRWWNLDITLPPQYPTSPPIFRFVDVPYHPNVSPEGRVLFTALDRGYTPDKTIWDLVVATRNLLSAPEVDGAVNQGIAREFVEAPRVFEWRAWQSTNHDDLELWDGPYTRGSGDIDLFDSDD
jgi:ubiquitin-protein ligase